MKLAHAQRFFTSLSRCSGLFTIPVIASVAAAQATPGLMPMPLYESGGYTSRIEAADLNGDGRKELILSVPALKSVGVAVANAQGGFNAVVQYNAGVEGNSIALADVNNDGRLDVALGDRAAGKIVVMLGNVNAAFGVPLSYSSVTGLADVSFADVTGDGKLDLLYAVYGQTGFRVRAGSGFGTFAAETSYSTGSDLNEVVFCDVNGDGKKDLVATTFPGTALVVRLNSSPGVYAAEVTTFLTVNGDSLAFGDLNKDGRQDVIFSEVSPPSVSYALGQANGTFAAPVLLSNTHSPHARVADVNNDTKPDIILTNNNQPYAALRIGDGLGGFAPETRIWNPSTSLDSVVADLNGDSVVDIAVSGGPKLTLCHALAPGVFNIPQVYGIGNYYATDIYPAKLFGASQDLIVGQNNLGSVLILQGAANSTFTAWGTVSMGATFSSMAVGDINSDGFPDIVTGSMSSSNLSIHLGTVTPGNFAPVITVPLPYVGDNVKLADMNSDNALDFVVTSSSDGHVTVLFGDGNGGVSSSVIYAVGSIPTMCAVGDFNGDGSRDFAVTLYGSTTLPIYYNNGAGGFVASSRTLPSFSMNCCAGDLNWDGCDELIVNYDPNGLSLLTGSPAGLSVPANSVMSEEPRYMLITDVTADGNPDFVCTSFGGSVMVKRGNGLGQLSAVESYGATGFQAIGLAVGDANADGRTDLYVGNTSGFQRHVAVIPTLTASFAGVGSFGFGTPGCRGTHGVRSNSIPKVGNADFRLTCTNTPSNSLGLALITNFADTLGSDVFNVGIVNHIQIPFMNNLIWADAYSDLGGNGGSMFPIPADPLLAGVQFYGQFIWLWSPGVMCDPSTFNLSASKGVSLTIQP